MPYTLSTMQYVGRNVVKQWRCVDQIRFSVWQVMDKSKYGVCQKNDA